MNVRWRKGLSGASGPERLVILQAERIARERAFGEWYQERCDEVGSILCDAHDLAVRSVSVEWARCGGSLLLVLTCHNRSAGRVRRFLWRVSVSAAIGGAFDSVVKKGLKREE